jgi:hypothetical protein
MKKCSPPEAKTCGHCGGAEGSASVAQLSACARCGLAFYCSEDEDCPICLEPVVQASATTLPCAHVFHAACMVQMRQYKLNQVLGPEELARRGYTPEQLELYKARALGAENGGGITGAVCTPDLVTLFGLHPRGTHE